MEEGLEEEGLEEECLEEECLEEECLEEEGLEEEGLEEEGLGHLLVELWCVVLSLEPLMRSSVLQHVSSPLGLQRGLLRSQRRASGYRQAVRRAEIPPRLFSRVATRACWYAPSHERLRPPPPFSARALEAHSASAEALAGRPPPVQPQHER